MLFINALLITEHFYYVMQYVFVLTIQNLLNDYIDMNIVFYFHLNFEYTF